MTLPGRAAGAAAHRPGTEYGAAVTGYGSFEDQLDSLFQLLAVYEKAALSSPIVLRNLRALRARLQAAYPDRDRPALQAELRWDRLPRLRRIVQDLKDFSRIDPIRTWASADLHTIIAGAVAATADAWRERADVATGHGTLPRVECLPSQIRKVVQNLLVNAAQAIEGRRGSIVVRTGSSGGRAWIEVADNGCGIARDALPCVFDPFYTTKPVDQGIGLGLSLAFGIVQQHQGRIGVTSESGRGTTVRMSLPVSRTAIEFTDTVPAWR